MSALEKLVILEHSSRQKAEYQRLDGIILECSGLADVRPVAQTFFAAPSLQGNLRLDAVICVTDTRRLYDLLVQRVGERNIIIFSGNFFLLESVKTRNLHENRVLGNSKLFT